MRRHPRLLLWTGLMLSGALVPATRGAPGWESDREIIAEIIRDSIGWALTKDRARLESILAQDESLCIVRPYQSRMVVGWQAFVPCLDAWMDPRFVATSFSMRQLRINLSRGGDVAWFSAMLDDCGEWGGVYDCWMDTRWTGVLERRKGSWRITQMHFSFAADRERIRVMGNTDSVDTSLSIEPGVVRLVRTGPLRAVAFRAEGVHPEEEAFGRLRAWAEPRGLLSGRESGLLLGRNDPPPGPGHPEYGYVYMLTIRETFDPGDEVEPIDLPAATYAVVRARFADLGDRWEALYRWAETAGYDVAGHGLEEHLSLPGTVAPTDMLFDLWLPVQTSG